MAKRGRPKKNKAIPPTPETVAKLEEDMILYLTGNNLITQEQHNACVEIRTIHEALHLHIIPYIKEHRDSPSFYNKNPFDSLTEKQQQKWSQVYMPWTEYSTTRKIPKVFKRDIGNAKFSKYYYNMSVSLGFRMVHDLIIENKRLDQIDNLDEIVTDFGKGQVKGQALVIEALQTSLDLYNEYAEKAEVDNQLNHQIGEQMQETESPEFINDVKKRTYH